MAQEEDRAAAGPKDAVLKRRKLDKRCPLRAVGALGFRPAAFPHAPI